MTELQIQVSISHNTDPIILALYHQITNYCNQNNIQYTETQLATNNTHLYITINPNSIHLTIASLRTEGQKAILTLIYKLFHNQHSLPTITTTHNLADPNNQLPIVLNKITNHIQQTLHK